jgi:hypothetical protein
MSSIGGVSFKTFSNTQNVVSFCEKRLNPTEVNGIIQNHRDGVSSSMIETYLNANDYISALSLLWGERDSTQRLTWLRDHENQLHAPLLYEQAIAEFKENPTVETVIQVSLPLIKAGTFRLQQDARCSADSSVSQGDAHIRMEMTYGKALQNAVNKYNKNLDLPTIKTENEEAITQAVLTKMKEIAEATLANPEALPSPNWIGYHGMDCFLMGGPSMLDPSLFVEKRISVANQVLEVAKEKLTVKTEVA